MFVVGLTGGIGSGKSAVAGLFAEKGITVINADSLAREVVTPGSAALAQIAERYGPEILDAEGKLKRRQLREIVFADALERCWLEELLHPLIGNLMQTRITDCESVYCLLESPLLLETEQHKLVDRILVVDVSEQTQLHRTLHRDKGDESTIRAIIKAQMSRKDRLHHADDVIENEQDFGALETAVSKLHRNYLQFARQTS